MMHSARDVIMQMATDSIIWHALPIVLRIYLWLDDLDSVLVVYFIATVVRAELIAKKKKKGCVGSHLHHCHPYLKV